MTDPKDRITPAIERQRAAILAGVRVDTGEPIDPAALAPLEKGLENSLTEVFAYQNLKSRAQLAGIISVEEAIVIYNALGRETPSASGWAADADLATKVVVTSVLGSLAGVR